ncbi:hypothetical protein MO973_09680 [Paenibacillus sp. TRM 82003]|uniref:hypothetical protein n=1 Tax=Kineococcus sp. TRM81007 TaxID=2925831 RepID=UPI001F5AB7B4|nr:hypothetical protein [Kineococcus sp. TRM81007]MCI2238117.1 hypothetical protein [Kineococcus sp. TRM81007]MCI3920501.1 hypothetical protein [Paenibacillus sp. TRM 82003]
MPRKLANPTSSSSSFEQTGPTLSSSTDKILELGKQLAAAMEDWDVLGRWMAHYVAELIVTADEASGEHEALAAKSRAAQEIRLLWSHRAAMRRPYPMENFDRILTALDHLEDPTARSPLRRYFGDDAPSEADLRMTPLLEIAVHLDEEISAVIACLIAEAAATAENAEARWVPAAVELEEVQRRLALRKLRSMVRRSHLGTREQPLALDTYTAGIAPADEAATDEALVDESANEQLDQENTAARKEALMEALDQVIETLSQLRSTVSDTAS